MKKIIIDTDPGVDDALAIMFAIKNKTEILGLTTVFGNADIENTSKNALKILSILNSQIPVYKGLEKPLKVENILAKSHGVGGFGGYDVTLSNKLEKLDAISFLIETLENSQEKITIICLGPTTNIARISILKPESISKIDKLIILGGVLNEKGNISPFAEFNVYNDPDALKEVLKLDVEKYLIPINVCRKVYFTLDDFDKINNENIGNSIKQITKQYIDYYQNDVKYGEFAGGVMYDLLATAFFTNPDLFSFKESYIEVETRELPNIGETYENNFNKSNCFVITGVDEIKLKDLFFKVMNK